MSAPPSRNARLQLQHEPCVAAGREENELREIENARVSHQQIPRGDHDAPDEGQDEHMQEIGLVDDGAEKEHRRHAEQEDVVVPSAAHAAHTPSSPRGRTISTTRRMSNHAGMIQFAPME